MPERRRLRDVVAVSAMRTVNAASRAAGRGDGTVAGGRVALCVAPRLAAHLTAGREVALVSGTNGKTTTTAFLAAALGTLGEVASNTTGANMPPGHVAALAERPHATRAVLECDEVWLPKVLAAVDARAVVLLNLSRDQLDRTSEVRQVADAWRRALEGFDGWCVANADDPLVVHAAGAAPKAAFFAGGLAFRLDAVACPACAAPLVYAAPTWHCSGCGLHRPVPEAEATEAGARVDGHEVGLGPSLPGAFNKANALGALLCAVRLGADAASAAQAIEGVTEVAGRFSTLVVGDVSARLMLAKNPAGWGALLDLVDGPSGEGPPRPLVLAVNANVADGRDPSWLYDVAFERLAGREVVATGLRWRDLSTRLDYARVLHRCEPDARAAIASAGATGKGVDVIANYTAFSALHGGR